jgi:hypothetical protein
MPRERRISVRLPEVQMDRVQEFCEDTDHDISHVVRQSLDAFLAPKSGTASNSGPPKRLSPPQAIIPLTVPYRAWGTEMLGGNLEDCSLSFWRPVLL